VVPCRSPQLHRRGSGRQGHAASHFAMGGRTSPAAAPRTASPRLRPEPSPPPPHRDAQPRTRSRVPSGSASAFADGAGEVILDGLGAEDQHRSGPVGSTCPAPRASRHACAARSAARRPGQGRAKHAVARPQRLVTTARVSDRRLDVVQVGYSAAGTLPPAIGHTSIPPPSCLIGLRRRLLDGPARLTLVGYPTVYAWIIDNATSGRQADRHHARVRAGPVGPSSSHSVALNPRAPLSVSKWGTFGRVGRQGPDPGVPALA
jgi:hypothetical protein